MGKIKDGFKNLGEKLKTFPKGRQSKALARVLQFFAIMLVLTIFARGAAGVTMPEVKVASLTQQSIKRADEFSATVTATNKTDVKMPEGLTVSRVNVSSGSAVQPGDVLVTFDVETIEKNLLDQRLALQALRLELAELQKTMTQDDSAVKAAQAAVDMAQTAVDALHRGVSNAQSAYDSALAVYNAAAADEAAKKTAYETATGDETDPTSPKFAAKAAYDAAKTATAAADSEKAMTLSALNTAKAERDAGLPAAQKALDDARAELAAAQKAYSEATPTFNLERQKRQLEIQKKQREIETQQDTVKKLEEMVGAGGTVTAPIAGTVSGMTVAQGAVTTATDYVRISTGDEGYMVEFATTAEKARDIQMGSLVNVKQGNYYWGYEARVSGRSMPDENGTVTVRAQLATSDLADGTPVTVTVVYSDKTYFACVPVAAVRPESGGYYVLVLAEESTILGTQTVARKVTVTVQDQDNTYAAIDGIYEYDARIVVSSTKPVNDGDLVRVDEESTR